MRGSNCGGQLWTIIRLWRWTAVTPRAGSESVNQTADMAELQGYSYVDDPLSSYMGVKWEPDGRRYYADVLKVLANSACDGVTEGSK